MIPADAGAEIARLLRDAIDAGELPARAAALSASGTWRPAPAQAGGGPGTYATSLPQAVARLAGREPAEIAGRLAAGLAAVPWVSAARVTGGGYLTITVTTGHLAALPARIVAAGEGLVRSTALSGTVFTAPGPPHLASAAGWEQAWRAQRDALAGAMARAAGADVSFIQAQRAPASRSRPLGEPGPVAAAVAEHGADAVRYALARPAAARPAAISRQLARPLDLSNPFTIVRYAHADAASTRRWAAGLGLAPEAGPGGEDSGAPVTGLLAPQVALLDALSWLPERVAAGARHARPAEVAACLERIAAAWLDCAERCPALPFRGRAAPAEPGGSEAAWRLMLADAARIALAAGLALLGVSAPARM